MATERVLSDTELLNRLRKLGDGTPGHGYHLLCAYACVCPDCCRAWNAAGECACTPVAVDRA